MVDLPSLAEKLLQHDLINKSFFEMTHSEIVTLCEAVFSSPSDAVPVGGWEDVTIEAGELMFPFNCHPDHCWWSGGRSIKQTLIDLTAPFEVAKKYIPKLVKEDWERELVPFNID